MTEETAGFALDIKLDVPCEQALEQVIEALKAEGFGVLTRINVKDTFKEKLDANFREYTILGACNPLLAHRALSADLSAGLLLPCNVVVYEDGDGSTVSIIDPISMLGVIHKPELEEVAREAGAKLHRVAQALGS